MIHLLLWLCARLLVRDTRSPLVPPLRLARWHAAQVVAGTTAPQLLGGSIGGTISWSVAPQVTIR